MRKTLALLVLGLSTFAAHAVVATPDLLDRVAAYTQQFVQAAMPVAKRAYEIGLLTLQIDAAGKFLIAFIGVLFSTVLLIALHRHRESCQKKADGHNADPKNYSKAHWDYFSGFDAGGYVFFCGLSWIPAILSLIAFLDIWLWTKLICPELWLAHMAIQKLVN